MSLNYEKAIELLFKLRKLHGGSMWTNAVDISPAQQLRNEANAMEARDALLREIDMFLALHEK